MTEIAQGTVFAQLAAGDNSTFALTEDGLVYGWGTFRVSGPSPRCLSIN
jgi:regulator of chromosome condensation